MSVPSVALQELLARFLLHRRYIREDQTVRPEAFMPHPYPDLSVTRHGELRDVDLWRIGETIADSIPKKLYGRADVAARVFLDQTLRVLAAPTAANPNHVNIVDWPNEKSAQKIMAQEISARITRVVMV